MYNPKAVMSISCGEQFTWFGSVLEIWQGKIANSYMTSMHLQLSLSTWAASIWNQTEFGGGSFPVHTTMQVVMKQLQRQAGTALALNGWSPAHWLAHREPVIIFRWVALTVTHSLIMAGFNPHAQLTPSSGKYTTSQSEKWTPKPVKQKYVCCFFSSWHCTLDQIYRLKCLKH